MPDSNWFDASKDLDDLKPILKIELRDVTQDNILNNFGLSANRVIDDILSKFTDVPIPDVLITDELKHAAKMFICKNYKRLRGNFDAAKEYDTEFTSTITKVREKLVADRTDKTEVIFVTDDDALDKTYQPANIDEYLTRVF